MSSKIQASASKFDIWWILAGLVVALGIIIRIAGVTNRYLFYDEIWTLSHYSQLSINGIFSQLATPNNHPLNSLLIKWCSGFLGPMWSVRLPALISGCLAIPVICTITWLLFRSGRAVVFAAILSSFNAGFIFYSQQGRGYEIQIFLIALFLMLTVLLKKSDITLTTRKRYMLSIGSSITAILAMLTLSTSVLIIFAVLLWEFIERIVNIYHKEINIKELMPEIFGWFLCGTFAATWYILNYSAFRQGQGFGHDVNTAKLFWEFCYHTLNRIAPIWILFFSFILIFKERKKFFMLIWPVVFMMAGALLFKAGFSRIYLVLNVFIICAAAGGVFQLTKSFKEKWRKPAGALLLIVVSGLSAWGYRSQLKAWEDIDWGQVYMNFNKLEPRFYIVYPGCAGYPIRGNFLHTAINSNMQRLSSLGESSLLLCVNTPSLNGVIKGNQQQLKTKLKPGVINVQKIKGYVYRLKKMENFTIDSIVILKIGPVDEFVFRDLCTFTDKLLRFNLWLNGSLMNPSKQIVRFDILAVKVADNAVLEQLQRFREQNYGNVEFYTLESY